MSNLVLKTVKISELKQGDTVLLNDILQTVSGKCIKFNSFFNRYSFQGDCSKLTITKVQFAVHTNKGLILR
jgi:hypothetical protein